MSIKDLIKNAQTVDLSPELSENEKKIIDQKGRVAAAILCKRYDLQMNQSEFAEHMGVSQGMISKWENGDYNFTIATLQDICNKLDLKLQIEIKDIFEEPIIDNKSAKNVPATYSTKESPPVNLLINTFSSVRNLYTQSSYTDNSIQTKIYNSGGYAYATVR